MPLSREIQQTTKKIFPNERILQRHSNYRRQFVRSTISIFVIISNMKDSAAIFQALFSKIRRKIFMGFERYNEDLSCNH